MAFVVHFSLTKTALRVLCSRKTETKSNCCRRLGEKARPLKCVLRAAIRVERRISHFEEEGDGNVYVRAGVATQRLIC